jgi:Fe(3+) dicitrate transport protein
MFGSCTASGGAVGECEIGDSFNAGAASIRGLELTAQTEIISEAGVTYPISAIFTSTDASFDNTFSSSFWGDVNAGKDIPDLPDSQLAIKGGFRTNSGFRGDATLYAYGSTCSVASCSSGTEIDSYRIIDMSLSKQINESLDVYMIVENILNQEDIIARAPKNGARAQKPRTTIFGIRLKI